MAALRIIILIFAIGVCLYACISFGFAIYKKVKLKREEKAKLEEKPKNESNENVNEN